MGVWKIVDTTPVPGSVVAQDNVIGERSDSDRPVVASGTRRNAVFTPQTVGADKTATVSRVTELLAAGQYELASDYVNQHYSDFSAQQLGRIRSTYIATWGHLNNLRSSQALVRLSRSETLIFDDLDSWLKLGNAALEAQDWPLAFEAMLKASVLENDSDNLTKLQQALINIAANYRSRLEQQGDILGVHNVYQQLYTAHPGYPHFQFELANSFLRISDTDKARPLFEQLSYDPELGSLSRSILVRINAGETALPPRVTTANEPNSISIALQRRGTNLLANVGVNRRSLALLLDTGASITAVDTNLIPRLGLEATGRFVQLSTANGVRRAELYRVQNLRLGQFKIQNHLVAGIDLGANSGFAGLLGTDLLNAIDRYSYVIDNQQSALIFRPK